MQRDSGCAVEVRCLLLHDRRSFYDTIFTRVALRLPDSADSRNECYHTLALHSFVGGPSAEPQGWQTTSGEAMFVVWCVLWGLANCSRSESGKPGQRRRKVASPTRRLALIVSLQFSAGEAGPKRLVTLQTLARFQAQHKTQYKTQYKTQ